ncbi:MAG: hypothetical protein HY226_04275 [Candidatus Vogelbacteria bacterium]|nr:hypothetical protein [Candidatus Vogelbacteria bacterium]
MKIRRIVLGLCQLGLAAYTLSLVKVNSTPTDAGGIAVLFVAASIMGVMYLVEGFETAVNK